MPPQIAGRLDGAARDITLGIRPEFVHIDPDGELAGRVALIELMGSRTLVLLDCGGQEVRVLIQGDPPVREGDRVNLSLQLERAFYFAPDGANLLEFSPGSHARISKPLI